MSATEPLDPVRAMRLLRAKAAELEAYVKPRLGGPGTEPIDWLIADIALIAGLLADHIERTADSAAESGNPMPTDLSKSEPRPKWTEAIRMFLMDDILADDKYGYPADGTADDLLEELEAAVYGILCKHFGHEIIDDMCGIPDHRYCVYCNRRATDLA